MTDLSRLIDGVRAGERRLVARALSLVENDHPDAETLLTALHDRTLAAHRLGLTGPPGAGKSTLTTQLIKAYRAEGKTVGVLAVDPTSPFTGGALLGDRVRMGEVWADRGVFIRSMATRGSLGGLARRAEEAADVLAAAGCDVVLIETVGVGQSELDIAGAADTTVVVLVPESGDAIQAMKAGLMEIADLFVLNKADHPEADAAIAALRSTLGLRDHSAETWMPPVVRTVARTGDGVPELVAAIEKHRLFLAAGPGAERRAARLERRVRAVVEARLREEFWTNARRDKLTAALESAGTVSPYALATDLVTDFLPRSS